MPIKPENKARYPKNWKEVRARILARANWRCEHPGCSARHGDVGYWLDGTFHPAYDPTCAYKLVKIVLTIAHLDHTPENCSDDNLRAMCQRHHLAYDLHFHQQNAARTRLAGKAYRDLFQSPDDETV